MKFLLLFLLSISQVHASLPELFGSSAGTIAIGNQAERESAANNYFAPALTGYSQTTQFSFNTFYLQTAFKDIDDVVVKNETTTVDDFDRDDVEVNPTPTVMFSAHISTPLFSPTGPKFNLSIFAPFDRLMEADSGDPYQPRYVMYENRFIRPVLIFTGSQSFGEWSFAGGVHTGLQSNGETYFVTRTSAGSPSVGKVSFNAKPSIGAILSVAKKTETHQSYLTFQQEMKSRLQNRATGETEAGGGTSFQFDFDVHSLLYYDPMTIRAGHQLFHQDSNWFFSLEYQDWDSYTGSTLRLKKRGGIINGSNNYEKLKLRNIFIPKIGYEKSLSELWKMKAGYFYRQSPLNTNNLKHSGNTIDVDKHVLSLGLARLLKLYGKNLTLDAAYQAHLLRSQKITKTANREDGDPSEPKIGSPGYDVGGMIHVLTLGLSWMY